MALMLNKYVGSSDAMATKITMIPLNDINNPFRETVPFNIDDGASDDDSVRITLSLVDNIVSPIYYNAVFLLIITFYKNINKCFCLLENAPKNNARIYFFPKKNVDFS